MYCIQLVKVRDCRVSYFSLLCFVFFMQGLAINCRRDYL
ncbi:hypothetical protein Mgra_00008313 [Meloidogyne graminicola]|uniref:Uncharacterized protein n=1 Tax=Meloidogyne graminicola TaxID=189291 RepID=A0A8S9ZG60_9BILA|nr:hypothetical protein Mgra_00008313 [Meloidogyne graminicola]